MPEENTTNEALVKKALAKVAKDEKEKERKFTETLTTLQASKVYPDKVVFVCSDFRKFTFQRADL